MAQTVEEFGISKGGWEVSRISPVKSSSLRHEIGRLGYLYKHLQPQKLTVNLLSLKVHFSLLSLLLRSPFKIEVT